MRAPKPFEGIDRPRLSLPPRLAVALVRPMVPARVELLDPGVARSQHTLGSQAGFPVLMRAPLKQKLAEVFSTAKATKEDVDGGSGSGQCSRNAYWSRFLILSEHAGFQAPNAAPLAQILCDYISGARVISGSQFSEACFNDSDTEREQ